MLQEDRSRRACDMFALVRSDVVADRVRCRRAVHIDGYERVTSLQMCERQPTADAL